jgi:sterol desaturase/sphingolipid hydroxylase (fatty acid hydroxylase superfamily)
VASLADALAPLVAVAVPSTYVVAVGLIALEFVLLLALREPLSHRSGRTSLLSGGLAFGGVALANTLFYAAVLEFAYVHRVTTLGLGAGAWLFAFVTYDFSFWLGHVAGHRVRLLWCIHGVHHSATEMRLSTAIRGSAFDFLQAPWFFVWIPLLGVHPAMLLVVESAGRIWGVLTHLSPRLIGRGGRWMRWLELAVVTPSLHRVHHAREHEYLDRNYGEVLTIWDRLFGSFAPEGRAPTYGLLVAATDPPLDDGSLVAVQLTPWRKLWHDVRRAPTWSTKLRYVFDVPGWSHDGPDLRVPWGGGRRVEDR